MFTSQLSHSADESIKNETRLLLLRDGSFISDTAILKNLQNAEKQEKIRKNFLCKKYTENFENLINYNTRILEIRVVLLKSHLKLLLI